MTRTEEILWLAGKLRYLREAGPNAGFRVEGVQKWCGGKVGESWCAYFATMVLDICFEGASPIPRLGSCDAILSLARERMWTVQQPVPGDLYLLLNSSIDAHHVGFVVGAITPTSFLSRSGNTSGDGGSNGDRVADHTQRIVPGMIVFVHYPR